MRGSTVSDRTAGTVVRGLSRKRKGVKSPSKKGVDGLVNDIEEVYGVRAVKEARVWRGLARAQRESGEGRENSGEGYS